MTLTYDDNGNLTDDGIFKFTYDAWNRLVAVKSRYSSGTTQTTFATYAYDGANRRTSKVVTNNGVEVYPNDGGETTVNFYYDDQWRIVETRNGSNQATWQHLWGTQYIDELIWLERNGDPTIGNDTDPDGTAGEGAESPADHRYFAHQDRNWNVVALTDHGIDVGGTLVERYTYTPYGDTQALQGGVREAGNSSPSSTIGATLHSQGLSTDQEISGVFHRNRTRDPGLQRFSTRDPLRMLLDRALPGTVDRLGANAYSFVRERATASHDPSGLCDTPRCGIDPPTSPSCSLDCLFGCADPGKDGEGPPLGFAECCCGVECYCVCEGNIRANFPYAQRIVEGCNALHEHNHICEENLCDPDEHIPHCGAAMASMGCVLGNYGRCAGDNDCLLNLIAYNDNSLKNCGKSDPPCTPGDASACTCLHAIVDCLLNVDYGQPQLCDIGPCK
ncbi:MAG: hypothetical protein CHACPFDD_00269 [Phycisphaerae bacterium]|nr:hypothetical protein [Phycisphaerae bacterium]